MSQFFRYTLAILIYEFETAEIIIQSMNPQITMLNVKSIQNLGKYFPLEESERQATNNTKYDKEKSHTLASSSHAVGNNQRRKPER